MTLQKRHYHKGFYFSTNSANKINNKNECSNKQKNDLLVEIKKIEPTKNRDVNKIDSLHTFKNQFNLKKITQGSIIIFSKKLAKIDEANKISSKQILGSKTNFLKDKDRKQYSNSFKRLFKILETLVMILMVISILDGHIVTWQELVIYTVIGIIFVVLTIYLKNH